MTTITAIRKPANFTFTGFFLALRASGRTPKTERTYRQALEALERFSEPKGMPAPENMTAEHLREFFLDLYNRGHKPGGVACRYRSLRAYYKWLVSEGERPDNPLSRIPSPKVPEQVMIHYSAAIVKGLLASVNARGDSLAVRDTAIVLTLYDTGLRSEELCRLSLGDTDLGALGLKVMGKGQKERIVGIGYKAAQAIDRYLRHSKRVGLSPEAPLFATEHGNRLNFSSLRLMLKRRFQRAGIPFHGAHAFRRGFAISYLGSGGSPEDLRTLAGWESPQMLRHYTKATEAERALKGHRDHSPGDRL